MYAAKVSRSYREYQTVTREQAFARGFDLEFIHKGYDFTVARDYLTRYPDAIAVDFCRPEHNTNLSRYKPPSGYICYVKSTHGRWGKSKRVRFGEGVTL